MNNMNKEHDRLKNLRHLVLDMDGTIYKGSTLFPYTFEFFSILEELQIGYTYLTNNSAYSVMQYLDKLHQMGLRGTEVNIYTSALMTIDYLKMEKPAIRNLFILGTCGLKSEFQSAGFTIVDMSDTQRPDAVIVGFDPAMDFQSLCKAAYWIKQGLPFIATHPDRICPTDQKTLLLDCGSICAAVESATGRAPDIVLGKPDPGMVLGILSRNRLKKDEVAIVGDRLYTDIEMARRAVVLSVLVLSGETRAEDLGLTTIQPDIVVNTILDFGKILKHNRGK